MTRRLIYAPRARDDLDAVRRWLTQPDSGQASWRRLTMIRSEIQRLRQSPCLCPVGQHPGVREPPVADGYRALYEVIPDTGRDATAGDIRVLRVFGPGQSRDRI